MRSPAALDFAVRSEYEAVARRPRANLRMFDPIGLDSSSLRNRFIRVDRGVSHVRQSE